MIHDFLDNKLKKIINYARGQSLYSKTSLSILQCKQRCNKSEIAWLELCFIWVRIYKLCSFVNWTQKFNQHTRSYIHWGIFTIAIKMANDNAQNLHAVCSNWLNRHGLTEMCKFLEFILENCTIWFNCFDWYREMQIANSALHKVAKQKRNSLWIKLS